MHELAVCQALIDEVRRLATNLDAQRVCSITVQVGPLSGVEPALLEQAYTIARAGTVAESASLVLETTELRILCETCDAEAAVSLPRLVCPSCGNWRTKLIAGDELVLARVEVESTSRLH